MTLDRIVNPGTVALSMMAALIYVYAFHLGSMGRLPLALIAGGFSALWYWLTGYELVSLDTVTAWVEAGDM